jgi:ribonuclease P protein component
MRNMESSLNGKIPNKIIQEIYQSAEKIYSKSVVLLWKKAEQENTAKILISVPKKKIKKAVDRNYIKRIIREICRTTNNNKLSSVSKPIWLILIYNKTTKPEFNKLKTELFNLFQTLINNVNESN